MSGLESALAHEGAFRDLAPALSVFLTRYVDNAAIAEELVQDLFLAMWVQRATMRIDGSIRAYLFTAARNRALNYLKHEHIGHRFRVEPLDPVDTPDPGAFGETDCLTVLEVQAGMKRLPPRCRLIFTMSRWQGLTYSQIAAALGISVKTVEVQMGRALRTLRAACL